MTAAADRRERTDRRLRLRRTAKLYALPAIGLLAMLLVGELFRIDMRDVAAAIWGGFSALLVKLGVDVGQYSASRWIANGLFGLVAGSVATGLLNRLGVIDRLFPDPPTFVFADLEAERTRTLLEVELGTPPPLTGREAELNRLEALLDRHGKDRFAVVQATGPTGIGKTRLSVEWLARAEAAGWDIGVIDPERLDRVRGWKARRPTALVLDEADSPRFRQHSAGTSPIEALLVDLLRGASKAHPVRLVLAGQTAVWGAGQAPETLRPYLAPGDLVLAPLDQDAMAALAGKLASEQGSDAELIQRESAGRPRHAIVLARAPEGTGTYRDALNEWANRAVPALTNEQDEVDPAFAVGLIAAALVGPVPTAALAAALPEFAVGPLLRFFPGETRRGLETELPRLEPADWAQVLALRLLDRLPPRLREDVALPLLLEHPEALEASLGAIWRDYPHWVPTHRDYPAPGSWQADLAARLMALQTAFDTCWPERVESLRQIVKSTVFATGAGVPIAEVDRAIRHAMNIVDRRPFDVTLRFEEACIIVNAVFHWAEATQGIDQSGFAAVEDWTARLDAILALPDLRLDPSVRLEEAKTIVNATKFYGLVGKDGQAGAFDVLEQWGSRLDALLADQALAADVAIRRECARSAYNAVLYLGLAAANGREDPFEALDVWEERFDRLTAEPEFAADPVNRLEEAKAASQAVHGLSNIGAAGLTSAFDGVERWGRRLQQITAEPDLEGDLSIRLQHAKAGFDAMLGYGKAMAAGRQDMAGPMERWGALFDELRDDPRFAGDIPIRREEAGAIVNAMNHYGIMGAAGQPGAFDALERWGARFDVMLTDAALAGDQAIRIQEAKAVFNAVHFYGKAAAASQPGHFHALERWAKRFDQLASVEQLASDPDVRREEARAAANTIAHYGRAAIAGQQGAFDAMKRWGDRIDALIQVPKLAADPELRLQEGKAAVHAAYYYGSDIGGGQKRHLSDLERWEARLDALAADPRYSSDPAIRLEEARAAGYAAFFLSRAGADADWLRWRRRLARLIQLFAYRPEFSALAIEHNLTISDQESRGWPHGRYKWDEHGRELMTQPPHG